jgi:hypothetical protein
MKFVREQFWLAATAQNIKRLGAVPQPASSTAGCQQLETREEPATPGITPQQSRAISDFFNTHACSRQLPSSNR